jgi:hypothetical protein
VPRRAADNGLTRIPISAPNLRLRRGVRLVFDWCLAGFGVGRAIEMPWLMQAPRFILPLRTCLANLLTLYGVLCSVLCVLRILTPFLSP